MTNGHNDSETAGLILGALIGAGIAGPGGAVIGGIIGLALGNEAKRGKK